MFKLKPKKKPEDLGIKIVNKDRVFWNKVKEANTQRKNMAEDDLKLLNALLEMVEKKIKECPE